MLFTGNSVSEWHNLEMQIIFKILMDLACVSSSTVHAEKSTIQIKGKYVHVCNSL